MLNKYIIALVAAQNSILASARPAAGQSRANSLSLLGACSVSVAPIDSTVPLGSPTVAIRSPVENAEIHARAVGPATYTPNPNIGGGGSSFKDSAHFRVYGSSDSTAATTLKHLEAAHACFVETLGWATPAQGWPSKADKNYYKTNVYSRTTSQLPGAAGVMGADGAAGLAWVEVVDQYLTNPSVTVHEYGHALTYAERNWIDQGRTGAWWEPIANLVADIYISTPTCGAAKAAQGLSSTPGASVIDLQTVISRSYQVLVDGTPNSGNYYESWPFIAYLLNNPDNYSGLGSNTLLNMFRKYTLNSNDTPLHALSKLLSGTDATVQKVVGRYWAHMAYVDIGHAKAREAFVAERSRLTYGNLDSAGKVKSDRAPRYMGANINPLKVTGSTVGVTITSSGSYTATLVVSSGGKFTYTDVVNGKASVTVASGSEVSLVVANTPTLTQYDPFAIPSALNQGLQYSVQLTGATV